MIHNPTLHAGSARRIWLPLRKKEAKIYEASTRHDCHVGRAIGLVLATADLQVKVKVHNSIHCSAESECTWGECLEYAMGDHFIIEAEVRLEEKNHIDTAPQTFPGKWTFLRRLATLLPAGCASHEPIAGATPVGS